MILAATPLNQTRAAIVQNLYQLAFCRQLLDASPPAPVDGSESTTLSDEALMGLVREYAEMLEQADHGPDAELLLSVALSALPSAFRR